MNNKTKWNIDPNHSTVQFKIKHLGITNVSGTFDRFSGDLESEAEDFNNAVVHFEIDADSINTKNADREKQLRSPDLFNTEKYPKILFDGRLQKNGEDYELSGELTIGSTMSAIMLEAEFTGSGKGRFNDTRAGFEVNGKINRKDYGLTWNVLTEAGGFVIGEDVKLHFDVQLVKVV